MTEYYGLIEGPLDGGTENKSKETYDSAVDRVLARNRLRIKFGNNKALHEERISGLGSVVLGRLREVSKGSALNSFRLYAGLSESGELLIHRGRVGSDPEGKCYSFFLAEEGTLIHESTVMGSEGAELQRILLGTPRDFLLVNSKAVEAIYEDLMRDEFWDRLADKHANWGKPGYENVWR
jgi:hypothetical protein